MTGIEQLVDQHIREYESRLKHIDELMERAEAGVSKHPEPSEINTELTEVRQEREKLLSHIDELKQKTLEEWQEEGIEKAGPMIIWQAIAKRLEKLLERIART